MVALSVILEANCDVPTATWTDRALRRVGLARPAVFNFPMSVWVVPGDYDPDNEEQDYTVIGSKLIGPVEGADADALVARLVAALGTAGVTVKLEYAADD